MNSNLIQQSDLLVLLAGGIAIVGIGLTLQALRRGELKVGTPVKATAMLIAGVLLTFLLTTASWLLERSAPRPSPVAPSISDAFVVSKNDAYTGRPLGEGHELRVEIVAPGKISEVSYQCSGEGCGWVYPCPDGGKCGDISREFDISGTTAVWHAWTNSAAPAELIFRYSVACLAELRMCSQSAPPCDVQWGVTLHGRGVPPNARMQLTELTEKLECEPTVGQAIEFTVSGGGGKGEVRMTKNDGVVLHIPGAYDPTPPWFKPGELMVFEYDTADAECAATCAW